MPSPQRCRSRAPLRRRGAAKQQRHSLRGGRPRSCRGWDDRRSREQPRERDLPWRRTVAFCRRCDPSAGLCEVPPSSGRYGMKPIPCASHSVSRSVRLVSARLDGLCTVAISTIERLLHRDVADPDVEHLAFLLQISHRPDRLLQGDVAHVDKERARHPISTRPSSATPKELKHQAISPSRGRVPRTRTSTAPSSHAPTPKRPNGGWVGR